MRIKKAGYHGIELPDYGIGLDLAGGSQEYIFISHAHADHMPRDRKVSVYATEPTAEIMRLRGFRGEAKTIAFGEPVALPNAEVTFYPAGHILGSAMTYVKTEEGNLLYTGDYRTPPSPASEGFELPEDIDHFITEATFGLPIYRWEDHEILAEEVTTFASETLDDGYTPIFLAYNLGKAQEIMHMLAPSGLPVQIHGAGHKLCAVYDRFDIDLGNYAAYDRDTCEGNVLICPSSALPTGFASNVRKKKIAYCSGWAALESRRTQLTAHKLIPLSDHLDFFELITLCKQIDPETVYITHTPNPKVVQHYLNELGIHSRFMDMEVEQDD